MCNETLTDFDSTVQEARTIAHSGVHSERAYSKTYLSLYTSKRLPVNAMFGLGGSEIVLLLSVILLFFGAKKLPELAKGLRQGIKEFKNATHEINDTIDQASADKVVNR